MRDDAGRLRDILTACDKVRAQVQKGKEAFDQDELVQVYITHQIQLIGEAARGLSRELRARHPEIPWSDVIGMRNILVHEYFGLDLQEIWNTAAYDLPSLRKQIETIPECASGLAPEGEAD